MGYKEKYEEIIKNLEEAKKTMGGYTFSSVVDKIIPEPKESEDERIRKALKSFFDSEISDYGNVEWRNGIWYGEIVAWLEKQGKIKPRGNSALEVWKDMRLEVYQQASGNRHEPNYSDDSTKMFSLTDIDEIFEKVAEKQGEQKTAYRFEPKFKIGDWMVYEENIYQIHNISLKKYYECLRIDGTVHTFDFEYIDLKSRPWTIKDAKDGDILTTDTVIFIFNYVEDNWVFMKCGYTTISNSFDISSTSEVNAKYVHPATKEQRDLLFQKMKEVGYEWDADKKELKEIKQNQNITDLMSDLSNYEDEKIKKDLIQWINEFPDIIFRGHYKKDIIDFLEKQSNKKLAEWSEEDERMINSIIKNLDEGEWLDIYQVDWLKSFKDIVKPQLKQERSKEDKVMGSPINIKFKVGDIIKHKQTKEIVEVIEIKDDSYRLHSIHNVISTPLAYFNLNLSEQDNWDLCWEKSDDSFLDSLINDAESSKEKSQVEQYIDVCNQKIDWLKNIKNRIIGI